MIQSFTAKEFATSSNVGANLERSKDSIALAAQYPFIYAAAGIHPGDVKDAPADYQEQLEQLIKQPKVVAVGEIGLDYHYEDNAPRDVQIAFFKTQLQLANQYQLPVIIHDREAHADTMDLLKKYKPKGVVHCFSGSVEMAKEVIKLGMYVGSGWSSYL
ncbi:MAG: TatD family hydrolase [Eubacteriales bacterium]